MNVLMLSRYLGWFSLGLGATETAMPRGLARTLGLFGKGWLVRAFGFREIATGVTMLATPDKAAGPLLRVAGDILDLAVLVPALSARNRQRNAAQVAFVMVLGVTVLDVVCASALVSGERRRAATSQRARLRKPPRVARVASKARRSRSKGRKLATAVRGG